MQKAACSKPRACLPDASNSPLLVYHPQGGLGNCLFGFSSAALLATATCRRFAVAWGHNVNRQAGASYAALFQRPDGIAFVNASEGREMLTALGGEPVPSSKGNCTLNLNIHWNKSRPVSTLLPSSSDGHALAMRCPILHVRGNMYYAPILERDSRTARAARWLRLRGLRCSHGAELPSERREADAMPFFAAISRHLLVPHTAATARANEASVRTPTEAIIGVHVRSTILLALHKDRRVAACGTSLECANLLKTFHFLDCIANVREAAIKAGYSTSRVYVAADNAMVRSEARRALGNSSIVPTPSYLVPGREARGKMTTLRGAGLTSSAIDEVLLLSRTDGLVVWDLRESSYSAVAASWAAHRVTEELRSGTRAGRAWLGVHLASSGCARLTDAQVDPELHEHMATVQTES